MKECIFTICAENYIGLAQVLEKSIKKNNPELDFFIFVADEPESLEDIPSNCIISRNALAKYIEQPKYLEMAFKYNLTEFCTSIKPFCFKNLFEDQGYEKVIYLDPDIFLFSSIRPILDQLSTYDIILTPHILSCETIYTGDRSESGLMSTGMFNLGFLALCAGENANMLLSWWGHRLEDKCFIDVADNYFTDQRWMDFIPCFFDSDKLLISKDLGHNVAPWNFYERRLTFEENAFHVSARNKVSDSKTLLLFIHFSGFNYLDFMEGEYGKNPIASLNNFPDLKNAFDVYGKVLLANRTNFKLFLSRPYSYGYFKNQLPIQNFYRRIFRGLVEQNDKFLNPFDVGVDTFYAGLKRNKLLLKSGNSDRLKRTEINGIESKLRKINFFAKIFMKIIGLQRYILFLRFAKPFSKIENQLFLYNNRYNKLK